ncbi:MAG: glycosyltransferase family 2 protein [Anaerolineales bacterium]|nr:glycosyltransferase family 2 protein [Anaerolineales bacterium]
MALDSTLLALWQYAEGRTLVEIASSFQAQYATPKTISAALACLCEAGLLARQAENQPAAPVTEIDQPAGDAQPHIPVAAVIVNYNSRQWLQGCIPSLLAQTYAPIQIIVVDNGSHDGALEWLEAEYPSILRLQIEQAVSLAQAINTGAALATPGSYLLIINPDITLESQAVTHMVSKAQSDPRCAAVAAKLYFSWAPPFLNGLGNQVNSFSWGTDHALGHLDLGQFETMVELPSACFAAALVTPAAWSAVGALDEALPMYYEDSEWCYRARLLGFKVIAAPQAIIYHAFGGTAGPTGQSEGLSPRKLTNVVYGRLRFATKLLRKRLLRFLRNYLAEDILSLFRYLGSGKWPLARAYLSGWKLLLHDLPGILRLRRNLQARRQIKDSELFAIQRDFPMPFSWCGLPELTWDLVLRHYAPLIYEKRTRPMPEFTPYNRRLHLLIASPYPLDANSSGAGKSYLALARALSSNLDVTIALPEESAPLALEQAPTLRLVAYSEERPGSLQVLVENSDVAVLSSYMVDKIIPLEYIHTRLVISLHQAILLEDLQTYSAEPLDNQLALSQHSLRVTNRMLQLGDFFICEDEQQRDYWLGALTVNERINPLTFKQDASLRQLIDVVRLGLGGGAPPGRASSNPPGTEAAWQQAIQPLEHYCLHGSYAPDRTPRPPAPEPPPVPPPGLLALAFFIWRHEGFKSMLHRTRRFLVNRLSRD